jgi:hypothetical protein
MNVRQRLAPTTPTPTGNSFAGIAFNPMGQMFLSQYGDNRFYRLNNNFTLTLMGSFSTGGVGVDLTSCSYPMTALASDLASFIVESRGSQQTLVSWTAVNEQQKGYFIEYSTDAENWKSLGYVESNNNSTGQGKYSFTSSAVAAGRNYYRLKYVGYEGQYSYSEIKFIDVRHNNQVAFGSNPTKGDIQVRSNMNRTTRIFVFDLTGKLIKESTLSKGLNVINISHAPRGTYLTRGWRSCLPPFN